MVDVNGNGHSTEAIPDKVKDLLNLDDIKNTFTTQQMGSALEKLVEPGEKTKDLIMRAHYWSIDYKTAWMCLLWLAQHFHDKELEDLLMNTAAGDTAVNGYRIELLVQSVIGQINAQKKQTIGDKIRNWAGMGKDKNDK